MHLYRALVIYWRKKPAQSTGHISVTKKQPPKDEHKTLPSRPNMDNRKQRPPVPRSPAVIRTTSAEIVQDKSGPLYECTEPTEGYVELC